MVMVKNSHTVEVEERFNALLDEFGQLLRRAIIRFCPRDRGIQFDDIEQEARLRLWRALQREREITNHASYLYRIAATATIDAMRRAQARHEEQLHSSREDSAGSGDPLTLPAPLKDSPDRVVESHEVIQKVEAALAQLPDERRRAVGLYLQGLTSQDIAELLDWTEPKSRNLLYRGLKDLRKLLSAEGIEYAID
jgi:RNA polymerase sigma-70 factor (ECF subfamily)